MSTVCAGGSSNVTKNFFDQLVAAVWFDLVYIVFKGKRDDLLARINFDARLYLDMPAAVSALTELHTAAAKAVTINTHWKLAFADLNEMLGFLKRLQGVGSSEIPGTALAAAVDVAAEDPVPPKVAKAVKAFDQRNSSVPRRMSTRR